MGTSRRHRSSSANETKKPRENDDEPSTTVGRPVWSGSISFGLLNIPVSVHTAESRKELHFNQLDKRDMSPIGYSRINKTTGKAVDWSDIVKGYEFEKGQFVVLTDDDFKKANVEASQTIDIQDFVDAGDIDPSFYETPYYLAPAKKAQKAYVVLREALRKQKKAAIATFVLRSREHLCAVFAQEDVLLLELLRFSYELRTTENLALPTRTATRVAVHPKELEMAERLIEGMSSKWEPSKYRDHYRDDLLAKIEEKAKTGKTTPAHAPKQEAARGNVVDIMSLLRRSVEQRQKGSRDSDAPTATKRAPKKMTAKKTRSSGKAA